MLSACATLFVGWMNPDPRSFNLHTGIGVVIYNIALADLAGKVFQLEPHGHARRLDIELSRRCLGQSESCFGS
jgi:hypothetical protein